MANTWRSWRHPVGMVPALARVRTKVEPLRADIQIRQLRLLRTAYATDAGPDVLVFGDSSMLWRSPTEAEKRSLAAMFTDALGPAVSQHFVIGNGYSPRLIGAFLAGLRDLPGRPKVAVVPTTLLAMGSAWTPHPRLSYETTAKGLLELVEAGDYRRRHLPEPPLELWEAYDRLPAPSMIGARRTLGELRMIVNAVPANAEQQPVTKWQQLVRTRLMSDMGYAEELTPDIAGVRYTAELAAALHAQGIPSVAYVSPVNYQLIGKLLRRDVADHIGRNEQVLAETWRTASDGTGRVAQGALISPESDFGDPVHLNGAGRARLTPLIADPVLELLGRS